MSYCMFDKRIGFWKRDDVYNNSQQVRGPKLMETKRETKPWQSSIIHHKNDAMVPCHTAMTPTRVVSQTSWPTTTAAVTLARRERPSW